MDDTRRFAERLKIPLAIIIGTIVVAMPLASPAFAFHYSNQRWALTTVNVSYDLTSLGNLKDENGNSLGWVAVTNDIDNGRNSWNNLPSSFYIDRLTSTTNTVVAGSISSSYLAVVQCYWFIWLVDCDMTFNSTKEWTTGTGGFFGPYGISEVARHEFGHFVRFLDASTTNTIMYGTWDPDLYKGIKAADSNELTNIYG